MASFTASTKPEVFYINLEQSLGRNKSMDEYLQKYGCRYYRISAVTPSDIYIPKDVQLAWSSPACVANTNWSPPNPSPLARSNLTMDNRYVLSAFPKRLYIRGVCGAKANTLQELAVVYSHLLAIRAAVYSETATNRYALILEDDVVSPFDIDVMDIANRLFGVAADFGTLQLFNSKPVALAELFEHYKKDSNYLFQFRPSAYDGRYLPTWSTGAYLINRMTWKPIIDVLLTYEYFPGDSNSNNNNNYWIGATILSGFTHPVCRPARCCTSAVGQATSTPKVFIDPPPPECVYAPVGFAADSFIYGAATTYVLSMPLFASNEQGFASLLHQAQVSSLHHKSFRRIASYVKEMICGKVPLPKFAKVSANVLKKMKTNDICRLNNSNTGSKSNSGDIPFDASQYRHMFGV